MGLATRCDQTNPYADEFLVVCDRRNGASLGIEATPHEDSMSIVIGTIQPNGLIDKWNKTQPFGSRNVVQTGMKIVAVNERWGTAMLLISYCRENTLLHMTVQRDSREGINQRRGALGQ